MAALSWLNEGLTEAPQVPADDRGLLLGDGLFETLRVRAGQLCFEAAHQTRLERSAALLALPLPSRARRAQALDAVLRASGLTEAVLRLTVTRGSGPRGLLPAPSSPPRLLVTIAPAPPAPPPASLIIARGVFRDGRATLSRVKSLSRADLVLARCQAADQGAHEALVRSTQGGLAEATTANLFAVLPGPVLVTPPLLTGALPGVMRWAVLRAAASLGLKTAVRPLTEATLYGADEVFLTNAVVGTWPVATLAGRALAQGSLAARLRPLTPAEPLQRGMLG